MLLLAICGLENDVYILGDLNADLGTEGGPQACTLANEHGRILLQYLHRWKYLSYHLHFSPTQSTHTYESEAHGSLSTIDHFLGPSHMLSSISRCVVAEEDPINTSDHLSILAQMELCFHPHATPSPVESAIFSFFVQTTLSLSNNDNSKTVQALTLILARNGCSGGLRRAL